MLDWETFQRNLVELGFTLNARELAGLFWLGILVLAGLLINKEARTALIRLLRQLVKWKVLVPILCLFAWISLGVRIGSEISLWRPVFAKDTVYWAITVGIAFLLGHEKVSKPSFFKRAIVGAVSIVVLLQYLVNLSVFPFTVELLLQPIIAFLIYVSAISKWRSNAHDAKQFADVLLGVISLVLLTYTAIDLYSNRQAIDWVKLGLKALLPIWLTIWVLPYVYLFSLVSNYEMAFLRLDWTAKDSRAPCWAKLALICKLHLRIHDVRAAAKGGTSQIANAVSFSEAWRAVAEFQTLLRKHEQMEREKQDRLVRYAGSQETDAEGRRLDRRKFEETINALRWLATCQMGWYRWEGRYRDDLLERILDNDFTQFGLPKESGITMRVSEDGQSWYAWRRTVSGWCFAIGASGPPPNQWTYDGPEPPNGFPGKDPAWGDSPFSMDASRNWD